MNKTCKKYEMDLMHKASGEIEHIKDKDALEQHLKGCSVCQKVLKGFIEVDTFAAATRPPSKQFQEKMADLRQRAQKGLPADLSAEATAKEEAPAQAGPPPLEPVRPEVVTGSYPALAGLPPARDTDWEIGLAAREIYNCLKTNGPILIPLVRVKTGLTDYPFRESVGWLAREKKITIFGDPKTGYVSLNPREQVRL